MKSFLTNTNQEVLLLFLFIPPEAVLRPPNQQILTDLLPDFN